MKHILDKGCHINKLHGKIDQNRRTKIYQEFKSTLKTSDEKFGVNSILLTTDLAARGIDIPDVDWIVQFDPPQWSDQFVHRIGRTARAGKLGQSLLFLNEPESLPYVAFLNAKTTHLLKFKQKQQHTKEDLATQIQAEMLTDRHLVDKS